MHNNKYRLMDEIKAWCQQNDGNYPSCWVLNAVCKALGHTVEELSLKSKAGPLSEARKCYAWFAAKVTRASNETIGERINRNRGSIIKATEAADDLIDAGDEQFISNIQKVYTELKQLL